MSAITTANNEVTPTGADDDSDQFTTLKKWVLDGNNKRKAFLTESKRAYDFVANHQWSEDDENQLKAQNRPAVSFNRVAPIIKAVCGLEVNNRQSVVYLPRTTDDTGVDEARSNCARWMRDVCNAEDEESEAFRDLAITGEGWTETRMDYDDDPKGRFTEQRVNPREMGVNASASRSNYIDARMVYRVRELDTADAKAMFDEAYNAEALNADWFVDLITPADGGIGNKKDYPDKTRDSLERSSGTRPKVRLIQVQWWEREPIHYVAQTGVDKLQELAPDDFKVFEDRAQQMQQKDAAAKGAYADQLEAHLNAPADPLTGAPMVPHPGEPPADTAPQYDAVRSTKKCYYEVFLGKGMLGKPEKMKMQEFTFKAMTGERDETKKMFYGMLRDMFDPQMWANKWLSQTMNIMNTNAKGGIMAEKDAFDNVTKAQNDWADPTKIVWLRAGALAKNKIKERTAPQMPQGLADLMQFALSSLRDTTGVNLELLGQADREQAASLEAQRRQSAMTILATLFDSLRRYRKYQGRLTLKFVEMLPDGTLYRVLDKGQWKYVALVKQGDIQEYDVIIDEAPTSPDQKQAIWAITAQLLQSGIPLPPPVIIKLLKYSPYPESVVQEITDAMGLGSTLPPEQLQMKLQQAEQAIQVLKQQLQEMQKKEQSEEGKQMISGLKLVIDQYDAQTKRLAAEWASKVDLTTALIDAANTPAPTAQAAQQ